MKRERSFTLAMILDYCIKHTDHHTGPIIIAMLNVFLRDCCDCTQEERDMVDEVERQLLHPEWGDQVQGNKTSFGSHSSMVNFNLAENTDFENFFAALPKDLKRSMLWIINEKG